LKIILTHPNADFDAVAASLAAHKLYPDAIPVLPERLNRNVNHFLTLYRSALPFAFEQEFRPHQIEQVILVDTQRLPSIGGLKKQTPVDIIDHHQPFTRDDLKPHETFLSEDVGAATTILVERIQTQQIDLNPLEATLLALGIYEDTGSLSYGTTTPRDIRAAAWLLEQQAVLDTVRRFLTPPLNEEQQALFEKLMDNAESRVIQGHTVTVSTATINEHIAEISSVVHRLRDVLDPAALFVLVQMPQNLLMVCRSTGDELDVGKIARLYGGGGHERAAAATIYDQNLDEVYPTLWPNIEANIRPITRVGDLMSYGVQTFEASQTASDVAQQVRRFGHEGYPVIEHGRVVGLLTRRELDRTLEHNLGNLTLREIMSAGEVTLHPEDSVFTLEQRMVESGWGQIPVLDAEGKLLGIVTRTDLIKHWASTHPDLTPARTSITQETLRDVMGASVATLIEYIANEARALNLSLYIVGGAVRDLLLHRANLDIDFVVESRAIELAEKLRARYGGDVHSHKPFGTAKWVLDAEALGLPATEIPAHIDFATARSEFYEHPTALPTVYQSSIKLDLQRRDFTINTLAVQLSPAFASGQVLDFYGGLTDLREKRIRVLHSLSFVDDPTRILRALRFEHRLKFQIEPRTAELITSALPMLRRVTGERIRNELDLLLRESQPEQVFIKMQAQSIAQAIHPAFRISPDISAQFEAARREIPSWLTSSPDLNVLYWHILAASIPVADLPEFCERMVFGKRLSESMLDAARLVQQINGLGEPDLRPSQIVAHLDALSEMALLTAWLLTDNPLIRERITAYAEQWQHIHPTATGDTLRQMGVKPGPCYGVILKKLRIAWLDGEITNTSDEQAALHKLIGEECHDDS
jgi:tRNA nucleotidyltransferase (CCA-adding enzyme)